MHDLLSVIFSGLVSGSLYALLGLSIVIIFRATDVVNFAIGDIATIGVYVALSVMALGVPVILALPVTFIVAGMIGIGVERFIIRPLGPGSMFSALVITMGFGLVLQALIGTVWGFTPRAIPPIIDGSFTFLGVAITYQKLLATGLAIVAMLLVATLFNWTRIGLAMRASAEDHFAAKMVGIKSSRVASLAWFLGCGLAGLTAFIMAAETSVSVTLMAMVLFRAFAGVFLGGLNNMMGAAAGGMMIGIMDNLAGSYVSASFRDTMVFAVIVAILFIRPSGILGAKGGARV
ncbi:branched-chain amino acid ABC transporter permease [Peribacillus sp. NPDC097206]|uniref:branched-chain amino acid ABC transporter permease n=1 Tax=unclassified Peribacillus TaxID=2675266 RepID=UPI0038152A4B